MKLPRQETLIAWLFISPWLAGFLALVVYPFCASLWWSVCRFDMLSPPEFVGLVHYRRLADELVGGHGFGRAVWNTFYFAMLSVPLSIALGISLAVMLTWRVRGRAAIRALLFLPSVVPVVATSVLWMWLLDPGDGLVNRTLALLPLSPNEALGRTLGMAPDWLPGWFNSVREAALPGQWWSSGAGGRGGFVLPFGSKDGLVLMSLWGVGNFMIIYLAALGDVPQSLYEAAELDGAGRFRRFRHITLPMLSPVILFNLVMGVIQAVQAFTQVYIVSDGQGAPAGATLTVSLHLFLAAFRDLQMGYASAMAWTLFVVVLAVTTVLFRWSRQWVFYRGGLR